MTFAYLDGIPAGPVLLFALGWLALLLTTLAWIKSRRPTERCARCGSTWQRTERGAEFHLCSPSGVLGAPYSHEREWDHLAPTPKAPRARTAP